MLYNYSDAKDALKIIDKYDSKIIDGVKYTSESMVRKYKTTSGEFFTNLYDAIEEQVLDMQSDDILKSHEEAIYGEAYRGTGFEKVPVSPRKLKKLIKHTIKELKKV